LEITDILRVFPCKWLKHGVSFMNEEMGISGKRSYIHKARRSDNYISDEEDKQMLIDLLWSEFHIAAIRPDFFVANDEVRIFPDVQTTNYPGGTFYFELDGEYHGAGDITTSDKTWRRNHRYEESDKNLIIINKEDTNGYEKNKIMEILKDQGFRRNE